MKMQSELFRDTVASVLSTYSMQVWKQQDPQIRPHTSMKRKNSLNKQMTVTHFVANNSSSPKSLAIGKAASRQRLYLEIHVKCLFSNTQVNNQNSIFTSSLKSNVDFMWYLLISLAFCEVWIICQSRRVDNKVLAHYLQK